MLVDVDTVGEGPPIMWLFAVAEPPVGGTLTAAVTVIVVVVVVVGVPDPGDVGDGPPTPPCPPRAIVAAPVTVTCPATGGFGFG